MFATTFSNDILAVPFLSRWYVDTPFFPPTQKNGVVEKHKLTELTFVLREFIVTVIAFIVRKKMMAAT